MTLAVELENASKSFGSVQALRNVSLKVEAGEVVAFLGPNGAGKTTAISIMLGLRSPSSGHARIFGQNPREPKNRARIGVMLQESGVPGLLKVRELIQLFTQFYHAPLLVSKVLEMANLTEKANAIASTLSGGQKQRLYFALAICGNPDVLFLDEPSVALDVESRRSFWQEISGFAKTGKTVILTTHYLEEADALANRIIVINKGEIVAQGSPAQIKSRVGGKNVSFKLEVGNADSLENLGHVQRFSKTGESINLYTLEPEKVLQEVFARGLQISNLNVAGAGLEEAFMEITERGASK
jgi:ABC-2 type transport system ATP-binding protein